MFLSLWQKLWNGKGGPARGENRAGDRYRSCRPQLDALEDRLLPAPAAGVFFPFAAGAQALAAASPSPAAPGVGGAPSPAVAGNAAGITAPLRREAATAAGVAVGGLEPIDSNPLKGTPPIWVLVPESSPKTRIDLGPAFSAMSGLRHDGGLKLSVLGNTNSGLVQADLSETALTLTYAPGKSGAATVTICATDCDGVSRHATVLVRVLPPFVFHPGQI